MIAFAYVSPRRVLRQAPFAVRVQFWVLVGVGVAMASVPVLARGDGPPSGDWLSASSVFSVALLVFNLGVTWQQLSEQKRRLEVLESQTPQTYVRKDVAAEQYAALLAAIEALRDEVKR